MASSVVDFIHSVLNDIASLVEHTSSGGLKDFLIGVKTFLHCARMLGTDYRLRFDAVMEGTLESFLIRIDQEIISYALKLHSPCRDFEDGSSAQDHTNLGMFPSYFQTHFMFFVKEIDKWYTTLLDYLHQHQACFPAVDDTAKIIDLVLEALVDIRGSHFYVASILLDQIEAMAEQIELFGNFIRFVAMLSIEHLELEHFAIHSATVAINAARVTADLTFMGHLWRSKESMVQTQSKISVLQQKITPIDPHVSEIYKTALGRLKSSKKLQDSSTLPVEHDPLFIMKGFIDFLLWSLWETKLADSCLEIASQDQLSLLGEGLRFLRAMPTDKFDDNIRDLSRVMLCDAGVIIFSLSQKDAKLEFELPDLLEKFQMIGAKGGKQNLESSIFNLPKTSVMDYLNFLLECLMEVEISGVDSNVLVFIPRVRENLAAVRSVLETLVALENQEDFQALWNRALTVASRIKFLIDPLVLGEIPNSYLTSLDSISEDIKTLQALHASRQEIEVKKITWTPTHLPPQSSAPARVEVVGLEEETKSIIDRLVCGSKQSQVISVVGMGGMGKTTLAKMVYDDPHIVSHFDLRVWCCISPEYNLKKLLLNLLNHTLLKLPSHYPEMHEEHLAEILRRSLKRRRYFIILDDVWSIEVWEKLRSSFPDDYCGSRILLTSRFSDVGSQAMRGEQPYFLRNLTDEESWMLLQKKIFPRNDCPPELSQIGKQIAARCKGLPLTLMIVAGVLKAREQKGWEEVVESLSSKFSSCGEEGIYYPLDLGYRYLPHYLKPCFLYFGLFPEDEVVSAKQLTRLWIAEGFVRETGHERLEDVAAKYMMDLIDRSLVTVSKRGSTGKVKACSVHDLLHEFCRTKAKEDNFFQLLRGYDEILAFNEPFYLPRLCIHSRTRDFNKLRLFHPDMCSILFFADGGPWTEGVNNISSIILVLKYLRVLDIMQMDLGNVFPIEIEKLIFLRYLAVRGRFQAIPLSTGNLSNLTTFIVHSTKIVALPETIWKLHNLRHVEILPGFHYSSENLDNFSGGLLNLESCSTLLISSGHSGEELLRKFRNIRKLKCGCFRDMQHAKITIPDSLVRLESLHLSGGAGHIPPPRQWKEFGFEFAFPSNLRKFTLHSIPLTRSEISVLGKLPNLEVLKLVNIAFYGRTFEMEEEEFPRLRFLKLTDSNIARWTAYQLPCLERLVLEGCRDLEEIPSCLEDTPTLRMIQVWNCSRSLVLLVRVIQEQQADLGNEFLEIFIRD